MSRRKFLEESSALFSWKHACYPRTSPPRSNRLTHPVRSILSSDLQNCYLAANPRFGSLPKVALAGILGYGLGKASYIGVCQSKFHSLDDQLRGAGFGPGHNRHCLLTCEECKIKHGLSEERSSQPSAS
ncbi:OCIA domain-containing protein 2 isoform X3 [Myotis myotis]|uniref:OCIA domain-containing protein 2 isoform X3 n=1 Tax=Myotis myotis TaxID=51298 RepID=UPI00174A4EA5|nr:OCIA domain-containing protein 2 isoform X3 [Myotis myotis]